MLKNKNAAITGTVKFFSMVSRLFKPIIYIYLILSSSMCVWTLWLKPYFPQMEMTGYEIIFAVILLFFLYVHILTQRTHVRKLEERTVVLRVQAEMTTAVTVTVCSFSLFSGILSVWFLTILLPVLPIVHTTAVHLSIAGYIVGVAQAVITVPLFIRNTKKRVKDIRNRLIFYAEWISSIVPHNHNDCEHNVIIKKRK